MTRPALASRRKGRRRSALRRVRALPTNSRQWASSCSRRACPGWPSPSEPCAAVAVHRPARRFRSEPSPPRGRRWFGVSRLATGSSGAPLGFPAPTAKLCSNTGRDGVRMRHRWLGTLICAAAVSISATAWACVPGDPNHPTSGSQATATTEAPAPTAAPTPASEPTATSGTAAAVTPTTSVTSPAPTVAAPPTAAPTAVTQPAPLTAARSTSAAPPPGATPTTAAQAQPVNSVPMPTATVAPTPTAQAVPAPPPAPEAPTVTTWQETTPAQRPLSSGGEPSDRGQTLGLLLVFAGVAAVLLAGAKAALGWRRHPSPAPLPE